MKHRVRTVLPVLAAMLATGLSAAPPFRVEIVDRENGWPVPLVELRTTHKLGFVTDNLGLVAIDAPELMDREVWFHLKSHGYGLKPDGFGSRGFRCVPTPGGKHRVEIDRHSVAKRLGRLTGAGLFAEAEKLGMKAPAAETGVFGCDSIQLARHRDRIVRLWGDTTLARYPLGVFHMTAAFSGVEPVATFEPPLVPGFRQLLDEKGLPRAVAAFPGPGPTWLGGLVSLPDAEGTPKLCATYAKIKDHLTEYELGLCVWDEEKQEFEIHKKLWSEEHGEKPAVPRGHPCAWTDPEKREWMLFGDPFPVMKIPADFASWSDPDRWEEIPAPASPRSAADGAPVDAHRGSVCWNPYRNRWITIFTQNIGKPSAFGEIWYAEADSPLGPWGAAVKVLSHDNYTFYNPRIHPELVPADKPFIVFEGTYTAEFADKAVPTPRYNYNQIVYRLDLDDPALKPARE